MHFVKTAIAATVFAGLAVAGPLEDRAAAPHKAAGHKSHTHKPKASHVSVSSENSEPTESPEASSESALEAESDDAPIIPHLGQRKIITVKQVYVGQQKKVAPALVMLNTYAKFGKLKTAPKKVKSAAKSAAAPGQTGTVAANPESYDEAYLSPVVVGGQTMNLDFDTGSADLWVYSTQQPATQQVGHTCYNPSLSPNATLMSGQSWAITYGDGSGAGGKVYADSVAIGGVTATRQAVEAATSVSSQFLSDTASNGLVGLAMSNLNTVRPTQQTTFFDTVKSTLQAPVFTAKLIKGGPGTYDFGFVNASKYTGSITYAPVQQGTGFWQFTVGGYKIGNQARSFTAMGSAIADTGTTLLYLPANLVQAYWASVPGSQNSNQYGGYIFPCSANLPSLSIGMRGNLFQLNYFTVPGNYLNYAPISNTMCFGGLQPNTGIGFSILGDVFLKSVFAVFDMTTGVPRVGFAKQS